MAEKLNWTFSARVLGGPTIATAGEMLVDAYTKINVTIPQGATQDVEVFPGAGGSAQVIVISPAAPNAGLTYKVGTKDVPLDGPHSIRFHGAPTDLLVEGAATTGGIRRVV
jgi:hypothetical protein